MTGVAPLQDERRPLTEEESRRRRGKNIALALILFGLFVLFYVITIVKMTGNGP
jgi:hypothetical protein